ncbi:MAG: KpsF/GutQ family sugar-phosphate isomerase [Saprospiraceae bacterium]|nr:KpsF/GutQ family sugar-phosphate isomerase [Saprospiraceae bacterium]
MLVNSIHDGFATAIEFLSNITGRIIITGIGKSAIVGQKIVATLNSTGTPAIFMHAADAIHGDLGMIQSNDAVVCISKSGETPEIKVLIPLIKLRSIKIISLCSNASSFLSQESDYSIHIPVLTEAEPNNLAPTASTTAQMAMGDAIAVSLLALKGFTPEDFAHHHPGGTLGKMMYMKVLDFAKRHDKPQVSKSDTLQKILLQITRGRLGACAVIEKNKVVGIITDGDLRRLFEKEGSHLNTPASEFMNSNPKFIQSNQSAAAALRVMQEFSISQLIVLNGDEYCGMIHIHDLLKEGII